MQQNLCLIQNSIGNETGSNFARASLHEEYIRDWTQWQADSLCYSEGMRQLFTSLSAHKEESGHTPVTTQEDKGADSWETQREYWTGVADEPAGII